MGIINVTPDSFYSASRLGVDEQKLRERVRQCINEGATILDIGACSTRPNAVVATFDEELERLRWALPIVKDELGSAKDMPISVDTFRANIAEVCVSEYGVQIINDVYGGLEDPDMWSTMARLIQNYGTQYVLTAPVPSDQLAGFFQKVISMFKSNIILDPGFGFGKTLEDNFTTMQMLPELCRQFPDHEMLVGVSRKSMIWKTFGCTPESPTALNGTTVLNTQAVLYGATILRVHDVREAAEVVRLLTNS